MEGLILDGMKEERSPREAVQLGWDWLITILEQLPDSLLPLTVSRELLA